MLFVLILYKRIYIMIVKPNNKNENEKFLSIIYQTGKPSDIYKLIKTYINYYTNI